MKIRFLLLFAISLCTTFVFGQIGTEDVSERIISYHSDIHIQKNRRVQVTETIEVYSRGIDIQHGIYREIPLYYKSSKGQHRVAFDLKGIKMDGKTEPYHKEWKENGIVIYIGDKNTYVENGRHIYEIQYEVEYVLGLYDTYDEFYWNVNGNGWELYADSVSATVYLPSGAKVKKETAYTGGKGSRERNYVSENLGDHVTFATTEYLSASEGLTVVIGWDKGFVAEPTSWDNFIEHLWNYALVYTGLLALLLGLLFNFIIWYRYGRDPKPGTIIPRYYPPNNMSPAECAYLNNEGRRTDTMMGAEILDLATKGLIEVECKGKGTYNIFKKTPDSSKKELIPGPQTAFYSILMQKDEVSIREGTYNAHLAKAGEALESKIDAKQNDVFFVRNSHLKGIQFIFPVLALVVGLFERHWWGGMLIVPIFFAVLHVGMNFLFARLYEQPTAEGRRVMDEIEGFKMYMKYANSERIQLMNPPSMDFKHFEENLAYAVALGIAKEWQGRFDQEVINVQSNMPYIYGMSFYGLASFSRFGSDISHSISSASVAPSTSGSGGGGGFGGGGFSGGGFGGGGGGGW